MAQQANERAIVVNYKGLRFTITDILVCPKCQSRLLSFSFLSIRGFNSKGETVKGVDNLFAYCLRCRSVFVCVPQWRKHAPTGLIPVDEEALLLLRAWFEASELPAEDIPDEFPF